jgi:hypothetical protein
VTAPWRQCGTCLTTVIRNSIRARKRREWDPTLRNRLESIETCVGMVDGMADGMAQRFLDGGKLSELGLKTLTAAARTTTRRKR